MTDPVRSKLNMATVILAAVPLLALAGCGGGAKSSWTFTDKRPSPAPTAGTLGASPLTPAERRDGVAIALHHTVAGRLLRSAGYRLVATTLWGDGTTLDGGSLTFALGRPTAVDADLPQADVPPDAPTTGECHRPYRQAFLHLRARRVTRLYVLVDFDRRKVADITTNARSGTLSWVHGKPHPDCRELPSGS